MVMIMKETSVMVSLIWQKHYKIFLSWYQNLRIRSGTLSDFLKSLGGEIECDEYGYDYEGNKCDGSDIDYDVETDSRLDGPIKIKSHPKCGRPKQAPNSRRGSRSSTLEVSSIGILQTCTNDWKKSTLKAVANLIKEYFWSVFEFLSVIKIWMARK